ncbi:MAG: class I SAM-dependent methyltransferase [Microbacteriaceae bacterium]
MTPAENWFSTGGENYAKFRPSYPTELASYVASLTDGHDLAVDVGCGTGQLTTLLAPYFTHVTGTDPSAEQVANATPAPGVEYLHAAAETLPIADTSADLITAAQAAHWFDLHRFYDEVRRIAKPNAVIALISYGVQQLAQPNVNDLFQDFYANQIGSFWPPERKLVDEGYRTIEFPFDEIAQQPMQMTAALTLDGLLGYISTWSAIRAVEQAGRQDLLSDFATKLGEIWGDPNQTIQANWPVNIRFGRVTPLD